jgi:SPP1 gp7 family putative phage head morphogenesis protein
MNKDQTDTEFLLKQTVKQKRLLMTPKQRTRFKNPKFVWQYPSGIERQYRKYLYNLMDVHTDIVVNTVKNNIQRWTAEQKLDIKQDEFNEELEQMNTQLEQAHYDMFDENGKGVERENVLYKRTTILAMLFGFGYAVQQKNATQYTKFTKEITGVPFIPREVNLNNIIEGWSIKNFQLIKSLSTEYIKKINFTVLDGVYDGQPWDAILKDVKKIDKNMTRARAKLITRDQVGKLNGLLTKQRMVESGLSLYTWRTARDERVRDPKHKALEGKIMRWDDNTVYADSVQDAMNGKWKSRSSISGYIGIPGQDIQCRCQAIPVFTDFIEEVDTEIKKENNTQNF